MCKQHDGSLKNGWSRMDQVEGWRERGRVPVDAARRGCNAAANLS